MSNILITPIQIDGTHYCLQNDEYPSSRNTGQIKFGVIICTNGKPYSASIYGQIGGKLT